VRTSTGRNTLSWRSSVVGLGGLSGKESARAVMRLLIYAMASSGSSVFCYFLAQRPDCVAVIDVFSRCITPPLEDIDEPIVAKATVTMTYSGLDHCASFKPDRTILFIRDPVAVCSSLSKYPYANMFGSIDEKMDRFDHEFAALPADVTIKYEDFVAHDRRVVEAINRLDWPCSEGYYDFTRSTEEIYRFNSEVSPWLKRHYRNGWGFGNITSGPITTAFAEQRYSTELIEKVVQLSPRLSRRYGYL
jgi:hypothetical protein